MTRSNGDIADVTSLLKAGRSDSQISRETGVPRSTVRDWRAGRLPRQDRLVDRHLNRVDPADPVRAPAYAYLLGMYLGDGSISRGRRAQRLRISLDAAYPGIVSECVTALRSLVPGRQASWRKRPRSQCVDVSMYFGRWTTLFPQHGPGVKHARRIQLVAWQETVVGQHHRLFVRGLLHSDGCRVVALDRGNASLRYHFSNRSEDIKSLYCRSLDALEIHWTRPSERDIAVYKKADTAALDEFVGPKT